jgi:hypothetical protein
MVEATVNGLTVYEPSELVRLPRGFSPGLLTCRPTVLV